MNTPNASAADRQTSFPILLDGLSIGYRGRTIMQGCSMGVRRGRLTCLIGANGEGKSTLLRTLAGLQPPIAGRLLIEGREITSLSRRELAEKVAVVLTDRADTLAMTARETVAMGRAPYTGFWGTLTDDDRRAVDRSLARVGILELASRRLSTLSDGERQKAMIAKALAQHTDIILLDEPTAFLDYPSKVEILKLLRQLSKEEAKTILMSTHDINLAVRLADDFIEMAAGGLREITAAELSAVARQLVDD